MGFFSHFPRLLTFLSVMMPPIKARRTSYKKLAPTSNQGAAPLPRVGHDREGSDASLEVRYKGSYGASASFVFVYYGPLIEALHLLNPRGKHLTQDE